MLTLKWIYLKLPKVGCNTGLTECLRLLLHMPSIEKIKRSYHIRLLRLRKIEVFVISCSSVCRKTLCRSFGMPLLMKKRRIEHYWGLRKSKDIHKILSSWKHFHRGVLEEMPWKLQTPWCFRQPTHMIPLHSRKFLI